MSNSALPPQEPSSTPYLDSLVRQSVGDQRAAQEKSFLTTLQTALESNPEQVAVARRLAQDVGVSQEAALAHPDVLKRYAALQAARRKDLANTSPILAQSMSDLEFARVAHDQIDHMGLWEGFFRNFTAGAYEAQLGKLQWQAIFRPMTPDESASIAWLQKEVKRTPSTGGFFWGLGRYAGLASNVVPEAVAWGAATATGAAAVTAATTGPAAPFTAPVSAATSFGVGSVMSLIDQSRRIEGGLAFDQYLADKYDPAVAAKAAVIVGSVNGVVEAFGDLALGGLGGGVVRTLTPFKRRVIKEVAEALSKPDRWTELGKLAGRVAANTGGEVGTEMTQETVTMLLEKWAHDQSANPEKLPSAIDSGQFGSALLEIAKVTAESSVLLAAIRPYAQYRAASRDIRAGEAQAKFIQQLVNARAGDKVAERAPDLHSQYLQRVSENVNRDTLYLDAEKLTQALVAAREAAAANGTANPVEQLNEAFPGLLTQIEEARKSQGFVSVPAGKWTSEFLQSPLGQAMVEHMTFDPDIPTMNDTRDAAANLDGLKRAAEAEAEQSLRANTEWQTQADAIEAEVLKNYKAVQAVGVPDELAAQHARYIRNVVVTRAAADKVTPQQWWALHGFAVTGGEAVGPGRTQTSPRPGSYTVQAQPTDAVYGTRPGTEVYGVHFSREARTSLDSNRFGDGIPSGESRRVTGDPVLSKRVYYYVDTGQGIVPELGLGQQAHVTKLTNVYNTDEDPQGIVAAWRERRANGEGVNANDLEHAIIAAGYDGYFVPRAQGEQGVAVLLGGQHTNVPTTPRNDLNRMSQFAGEQALTANKHALDSAKKRTAAGEDAEAVRKDTGWFKGQDGQWRFEISDREAKINGNGATVLDAAQRSHSFRPFLHGGGTLPLGALLDHPKLFAAFPQLRTARVEIIDMPKGYRGAHVDGEFAVNSSLSPGEALSTLLHEIQHGIQGIEKFAEGGNIKDVPKGFPSAFRDLVERQHAFMRKRVIAAATPFAQAAANDNPSFGVRLNDLSQPTPTVEDIRLGLATTRFAVGFGWDSTSAVANILHDYASLLRGGSLKQGDAESAMADATYEAYRRILGEIEARNVQTRHMLTEAERQATPPSATQDVKNGPGFLILNDQPVDVVPANVSSPTVYYQPGAQPLAGLPEVVDMGDGTLVRFGPNEEARRVAAAYMRSVGLPYHPPRVYVEVDIERAKRIARAYDEMKHDPNDPEVRAAYEALAAETIAQYDAMIAAGMTVEFNPGFDPYGNPRNALLDIQNNRHLAIFSTEDGYGSVGITDKDRAENPLLRDSGRKFGNRPALINDLFRAVHDYFGHAKEGVGFRARGEENAWQQHMAMYSPLARKAATTETRGQNSWVNFGPFAGANKKANPADTKYADQKIGLLPEWVMREGYAGGEGNAPQVRFQNDAVDPVDPGLIVTHSLNADALRKADKLGGLPVPSLGVVSTKAGDVRGFGDITLIGAGDLARPEVNPHVYDRDIYSARFPQTTEDIDRDRLKAEILPLVEPSMKALGEKEAVHFAEILDRVLPSTVAEFGRSNNVARMHSLVRLGVIDKPFTPRVRDLPLPTHPASISGLRLYDGTRLRDVVTDEQLDNLLSLDASKEGENTRAFFEKHIAQMLPDLSADHRARLGLWLANIFMYRFEGVVFSDRDTYRSNMVLQTHDSVSNTLLNLAVPAANSRGVVAGELLGNAALQWLLPAVDRAASLMIYATTGLRPATLPNIVDEMTYADPRNKEGIGTTGSLMASVAPAFSSTEQMRAVATRRLTDDTTFHQNKRAVRDAIYGAARVLNDLGITTEGPDNIAVELLRAFEAAKTLSDASAQTASVEAFAREFATARVLGGEDPAEAVAEILARNQQGIADAVAVVLSAFTTYAGQQVPYFEAKPQRAVKLSEFKHAVVPVGTPKDVLDILTKHGIDYTETDLPNNATHRDTYTMRRWDLVRALAKEKQIFFQNERVSRGAYYKANGRAVIDLNKAHANASTFLHEVAHWYLDVLEAAASSDPNSSAARDFNAALSWFGVDAATWAKMSFDERTKHHEAFASAFEAYLHEGKAPTRELRRLFARVASFIRNVYRDVWRALDARHMHSFGEHLPALNDEVRGLFDRMVASEDDITRAEEEDAMTLRFFTEEQATKLGFSRAEWLAAQQDDQDATDEAINELTAATLRDARWLANTTKRAEKELTADERAARGAVMREVAREVAGTPVERARYWLRTGRLRDSEGNDAVTSGEVAASESSKDTVHKLSLAAIEDYLSLFTDVPPAAAARLRAFGTQTGIDPTVAAEMFDFADAKELLDALAAFPAAGDEIQRRVDERMRLEYSDLVDPAQRRMAVARAIHNEARARVVSTMLRTAAKLTAPARTLLSAARAAAEQLVNGYTLRSITVKQFAAAERKAAKEVRAAMKSGDVNAMQDALRQQLLANQLVVVASEVQDQVGKVLRNFEKVWRPDTALQRTHELDIVNLARAILTSFGLGKGSKLPREYLTEIVANNPTTGQELTDELREVTGGNTLQNYRDLTLDAFVRLRDKVAEVFWRAQRERWITVGNERVERADAIAQVEERIRKTLDVNTDVSARLQLPEKDVRASELADVFHWITRVEHWALGLDGGEFGPVTRFLVRPLRDAFSIYTAARNTLFREFRQELKKLDFGPRRIATPFIAPDTGKPFVFETKADLLGAMMHMGTRGTPTSNLDNLLLGNGWAQPTADGTADYRVWDAFIESLIQRHVLTKADFQFLEYIWAVNEKLKPLAQAATHDQTGTYFESIKAVPFTNSLGTWSGGYVPAAPDSEQPGGAEIKQRAGLDALKDAARDLRSMQPKTASGFRITRVVSRKPIVMNLNGQLAHMDQVLRYVHLQPRVTDVASILRDARFNKFLAVATPGAVDTLLVPWLTRTANNRIMDSDGARLLVRIANAARRIAGVTTMMWSVVNAAQQITGVFNSNLYVSNRYLRSALWDHIARRGKIDDITTLSAMMRERLSAESADVREDIKLLSDPSLLADFKRGVDRYAYVLQRHVQNQVDIITWRGAFQQALAKGKTTDQAVSDADAAVRLSQGSSESVDASRLEGHGVLVRLLLQFTGYFNTVLNQIAAAQGWDGKALTAVRSAIVPGLIGGVIASWLRGDDLDDEDGDGMVGDEVLAWALGNIGRTTTALVPFGSFAVSLLGTPKPGDRAALPPAAAMLAKATNGVYELGKLVIAGDPMSGTDTRNLFLAMSLPGVPLTPIGRTLGYLKDVADEKVRPTGTFDFVRGLITGAAGEESRGK